MSPTCVCHIVSPAHSLSRNMCYILKCVALKASVDTLSQTIHVIPSHKRFTQTQHVIHMCHAHVIYNV